MRTTLDIEDDVLLAARAEARHRGQTLGQVVSELARKGLQTWPAGPADEVPDTAERLLKLGIHVLPRRGKGVVTNEMVNRIRDEEGI